MNLNHNIDVEESINKGVEYLRSKQNEDGSVILNGDTRWPVWETANSIHAVQTADNNKKEFLEKAVNFLLSAQRIDGSFCHTVSNTKDNYCMETTATAVLALATAKKNVDKTVSFMLSKQNQDGSWEIGIPDMFKHRFWPSITGFVLNSLLHLKISSNQISKGIDFLLEKQQENGSWGSSWIYYDTPYYPTHVILSTLRLYGLADSEAYKKSINFIENKQNMDGSWCMKTADKPRPSRACRTTLALNSLQISPNKLDFKYIERGINWLVKEQESDGHWEGGYFVNWPGKKEDIFATSMAIISLKKYEQYIKSRNI